MKSFNITDDSGFLAIVNADRYKSFVNEDWELYELMDHFIASAPSQKRSKLPPAGFTSPITKT